MMNKLRALFPLNGVIIWHTAREGRRRSVLLGAIHKGRPQNLADFSSYPPVYVYSGLSQAKINSSVRIWQTPVPPLVRTSFMDNPLLITDYEFAFIHQIIWFHSAYLRASLIYQIL